MQAREAPDSFHAGRQFSVCWSRPVRRGCSEGRDASKIRSRRRSCSARGPQCSDRVSSELASWLAVGPTPATVAELQEVLAPELSKWRSNAKLATALLGVLAKRRLPDLAKNVLTCMHEERVEANIFHFNSVLSAYEKARRWQDALHILSDMWGSRVMPDGVSYNAAISACEKGGEWRLALSFLGKMPELRCTPNEISYGTAIAACGKSGHWQLAFSLLRALRTSGLATNEVICNAAISACGKAGQWEHALSLLGTMKLPSEVRCGCSCCCFLLLPTALSFRGRLFLSFVTACVVVFVVDNLFC
ncbi:unnamed protein product [Polarella glacialis]|uniref:Pentacotripeptide-repeat region of PRORP domain-containing protein n=1 Tax=Polarella glacialis TaxID=89957 RepID=A0A813JR61_POLGL|nr:unnamed protein product [Polarella glacialis]CAE8682319.1 unnamed protein product [Polarella glacialis]